MNNKIQVRCYQDGDAKFLSQIYYNTIKQKEQTHTHPWIRLDRLFQSWIK